MEFIKDLFSFDSKWSDDKKRKSYILVFINFILIIFLFSMILIRFFSGLFFNLPESMENLWFLFSLFFIFVFMIFLIKRGFNKLVSIGTISILTLCLFKGSFLWGIDLYIVDIFYPLIILLSGLLVNSVFSFLLAVIISAYLLFLYFFGYELNYINFINWKNSIPSFLTY